MSTITMVNKTPSRMRGKSMVCLARDFVFSDSAIIAWEKFGLFIYDYDQGRLNIASYRISTFFDSGCGTIPLLFLSIDPCTAATSRLSVHQKHPQSERPEYPHF